MDVVWMWVCIGSGGRPCLRDGGLEVTLTLTLTLALGRCYGYLRDGGLEVRRADEEHHVLHLATVRVRVEGEG